MHDIGNRHMNPEEVERYSLEDFSDEETTSFDEHLLLCERCRMDVESSDAYLSAMRGAASQIRQTPPRVRLRRAPALKTTAAGNRLA